MCLSRTSLTIRHNNAIEAIEDIADDRLCDLHVGLVLACIHLEHAVKSEVALIETMSDK